MRRRFPERRSTQVGEGVGRRPLDTRAAAPTVAQVLRVAWSISALCVAVSTAVVLRGSLLVRATARSFARSRRACR